MFGFKARDPRRTLIDGLHAKLVDASRNPALYGPGGFPDSVGGRFEALVLHAMVLLRALRPLPDPAADVAQDLVDSVFAHLETALREMGIGDFGVPKRMKALARGFYDRIAAYEPLLDARDAAGIGAEIARRIDEGPPLSPAIGAYVIASGDGLAGLTLDALLAGPAFPNPPAPPVGTAAR